MFSFGSKWLYTLKTVVQNGVLSKCLATFIDYGTVSQFRAQASFSGEIASTVGKHGTACSNPNFHTATTQNSLRHTHGYKLTQVPGNWVVSISLKTIGVATKKTTGKSYTMLVKTVKPASILLNSLLTRLEHLCHFSLFNSNFNFRILFQAKITAWSACLARSRAFTHGLVFRF